MHINKLNEKGIGLVEVIAAFSISIMVITALVGLTIYTIRQSLQSKLLLEGTKIGTREIERLRAFRDQSTTWSQFATAINGCTTIAPCNMPNVTQVNSGSGTDTIDNQTVTRYFSVVTDGGNSNIYRVSVTVTWAVGPLTKTTHLYTDLSNWQNK